MAKAFIINKVSNATKIVIIFVFLCEIYFIVGHLYLDLVYDIRYLDITIKNTDYKLENTGTSCKSIYIFGLQCFNSSTKF